MAGKIFEYLNNSLFMKIFVVMVVSIVSVSILIAWSIIGMSERLFMETFSITNNKVMGQIKTSFDSFSYSVANVANHIQQSGSIKSMLKREDANSLDMARTTYNMKEQLKQNYSSVSPYEANMMIAGMNGQLFSMDYNNWSISMDELQKHPITRQTMKDPKRLRYHFYNASEDHPADAEPAIVASKALYDKNAGKIYGILYISVGERTFRQFYKNYTGNGNDVMVLDSSGFIVSSNQEKMIGKKSPQLLQYTKEMEKNNVRFQNVELFGKDYIVLAQYMPAFDMHLVNMIDKELMADRLIDQKEFAVIILVIVAAALIVVFILTRRMTNSLRKLVQEISNMAKNHFKQYVTVSGGDETRKLAIAFNRMLDELHEYVDQLISTQKKQRKAELEALQRQINPHFLYNTLTSVKFMVQQGDKEKAANTIHALITLLQNSIGNISETITVEQELNHLKSYVLINQARYGDRIKVNYFVSPDSLTCHVPKLIIQPFIENAFFHAFHKKKEGYIQILIARREGKLICEVIDNGDGMALKERADWPNMPKRKGQLFSGIGVRNVHERIQLLYGKDYGVETSSRLGEGTKIKISLPIIEDEQICDIKNLQKT